MSLQKVFLGNLVLSTAAQATSNLLQARELAFAQSLIFVPPAAFTGTITVKVAPKEDSIAGDLQTLAVNGTNQTIAAGITNMVTPFGGFETVACQTSGTEAAQRTIGVYAVLNIPGE